MQDLHEGAYLCSCVYVCLGAFVSFIRCCGHRCPSSPVECRTSMAPTASPPLLPGSPDPPSLLSGRTSLSASAPRWRTSLLSSSSSAVHWRTSLAMRCSSPDWKSPWLPVLGLIMSSSCEDPWPSSSPLPDEPASSEVDSCSTWAMY